MNRTPSLSRRRLVLGSTAVSAAAIATACGAGQSSTPPAALQPAKLTWWSNLADTHPESQTRVKIIEDFNAQMKPVEVVPEKFGASLTNIKAVIAADTAPDTYFVAWREGAEMFLTGSVADLDAEMKGDKEWGDLRKEIFPLMLETSMWKGKLTSMPVYTNNTITMWNNDLLTRAGLKAPATGWTWDDFVDMSKKGNRPPDIYGFELWADSSSFVNWYGTYGGRLLDQTGKKVTVGSPEGKETLQFMLDLGKRHGVSPMPRISTGRSMLFIQGKSMFEDTGPFRLADIRKGGITNFGAGSRPQHPKKKTRYAANGGHNLVVTRMKDANKLKAGLSLAKFFNRPTSQAKMCTLLGTAIPVSKAVLQQKDMLEYGKTDPQWKACVDEAPYGDRAPTLPSIVKMLAVLDTAINDVFADKVAVSTALDQAQREMQQLLDADLAM
ncbi:MAG TPA: extracellular solute-binding protein [Chloroflexota bacterium]|nr:extracellular solute-binding protein [Chloroflexota bacterium]